MFKIIFFLNLGLFCLNLSALETGMESFAKDKQSIKAMTGCYEVTFQNAETFALTSGYNYKDRYRSGALEWIFVNEESDKHIDLQHLLITPVGIIKHWRQLWLYENTSLYDFVPNMTWIPKEFEQSEVDGQWTQKVFQVDDSPRYECTAPWVHWANGKKNYWECEANAPLPRREFTTRKDYNILRRNNRHEIKDFGHVHDEDNVKVVRENGVDRSLVMEKGLNIYKKVDDQKCESAKEWWNQHRVFWKDVQFVWNEIYQEKNPLKFKEKIEGKTLWEKIFELDNQFSSETDYQAAKVRKEIGNIINNYRESI